MTRGSGGVGSRGPRSGLITFGLLAPTLLIMAAFALAPIGAMTEASFHRSEFGIIQPGFTLRNYTQILLSPVYFEIYWKTLAAAGGVTLVCAILGYPVAMAIVAAPPKYRPLLYFLVAASLLINTVVRTYGWLLVLGRTGVVNQTLIMLGIIDEPIRLTGNYLGLIIGSAQVFLPFMILSLAASLQKVDRRFHESAEILGATRWRRFRTITLPLSLPGLISGSVLVFSLMLGAFVNPILLGGSAIKYLSVSVYTDALVLFNLPRAIALSMVLLGIVVVIFALQRYLMKRAKRFQVTS